MPDASTKESQAREHLKISLAQRELRAQLAGAAPVRGTSFALPYCPVRTRERHQQRLATITALCAAVTGLTQAL